LPHRHAPPRLLAPGAISPIRPGPDTFCRGLVMVAAGEAVTDCHRASRRIADSMSVTCPPAQSPLARSLRSAELRAVALHSANGSAAAGFRRRRAPGPPRAFPREGNGVPPRPRCLPRGGRFPAECPGHGRSAWLRWAVFHRLFPTGENGPSAFFDLEKWSRFDEAKPHTRPEYHPAMHGVVSGG
jgi:hypothetical protein